MLPTGRRFDRVTALFLTLLAVGFILATFDVRADGEGAGTVLRDGAQTLFNPVQRSVDFVTRPVVGFMWSIGHSIRPNGEVLAGNPAAVDEWIPLTAENTTRYYAALLERATEHAARQARLEGQAPAEGR